MFSKSGFSGTLYYIRILGLTKKNTRNFVLPKILKECFNTFPFISTFLCAVRKLASEMPISGFLSEPDFFRSL